MVGLPVEVMADRERALETLGGLRRWMVGEHQFAVNGEEVRLEVTAVRAMAQPAGAFFAWGLDNGGRWARSRADLQAPVAVCDIGFNTLDLFAVEGGEVVGRFTGGDTAGIRRAAEMLIQGVRDRYRLSLSLPEADGLLRGQEPQRVVAGERVDLRPLVRQALENTASEVVTFIESRWGNGRQFAHLLFVGGGAALLREVLLRQYPHGVVLPDPVTANAVGLARYAVRAFK
jgi:plasmid segregation protein ParM